MFKLKHNTPRLLLILVTVMTMSSCGGGSSSSEDQVNSSIEDPTNDSSSPSVISVTPANGESNVSRTSPITATFDEDLFSISISDSNFTLKDDNNTVPATISYDFSTNTAILQPNSTLAASHSYTATLETEISDLAGNGMADKYIWNFTTTGRTWKSTAELIESDDSEEAYTPQIAMDMHGNALVVWTQRGSIWANHFNTENSTWGIPVGIAPDNTGDAQSPKVSVNSQGDAIVTWGEHDGVRSNIWASRYSNADHEWGTTTLIESSDTGAAHWPQIAIDDNGNAIAVWEQSDGALYSIWANHYSSVDNSWGTALLIETNNVGDLSQPQIALDSLGNAMVVWSQYEWPRSRIWVNSYSVVDNSWGKEELISLNNTGKA